MRCIETTPNYSIYVFTGLLRDMDDDEVAVVLGHELSTPVTSTRARGTRRPSSSRCRRSAGVAVAGEAIDNETARAAAQVAMVLGASAWQNGYGRRRPRPQARAGATPQLPRQRPAV